MGGVSMEWKEVTLGEIAIFKTGKLNSNAAISNGEYPFFTCSPETLRINSYAFDQEAILLAGNNAEGNFSIKYYKGKFNAYQRTYVITPKRGKVDIKFLYYALSLCLKQLKNMSQGTSTKFLTVTILNSFSVQLPSFSDQRRIASILSSLDRKIELNNKINADLEEMAQAIFKNWFVDFEPFKDGKFVNSELGMIPEGWKVGILKDLLYLRKDSIKSTNRGKLPYLPIDTIPMHNLVATDFKSNEEAKSSLQIFEENDIIVGAMRVYFHRVILAPCRGITRTTCFVLSVKDENNLAYSLMQCNQDEAISFAERTSKGSTMPYAVWDGGYGEYKIVIPPCDVMKSFNDLLCNFLSKMNENAIENRNLSLLRDTLLPRLMSGELEVPE